MARELGAEGVGLCRTEHMFFDKDRLPIMREMILSNNKEDKDIKSKKICPNTPYQIANEEHFLS